MKKRPDGGFTIFAWYDPKLNDYDKVSRRVMARLTPDQKKRIRAIILKPGHRAGPEEKP